MKKDKKYYGDTKLNHFCAFCGCPTETEDHVPSKFFLDKPHPQDLPVFPIILWFYRLFIPLYHE